MAGNTHSATSYTKRPKSSATPLREPQISHFIHDWRLRRRLVIAKYRDD